MAVGAELDDFGGAAAGEVEIAAGVFHHVPDVFQVGVGQFTKLGREQNFAVAAQSNALGGAFAELGVLVLVPEAGVFGGGREGQQRHPQHGKYFAHCFHSLWCQRTVTCNHRLPVMTCPSGWEDSFKMDW